MQVFKYLTKEYKINKKVLLFLRQNKFTKNINFKYYEKNCSNW